MSLDLITENQHAQVRVGGLVHGFGLDAHAVLLRCQLVCTLLLVPQVEKSGNRRPGHYQVAPEILPVQVDVFHAPAFDFEIEPTWSNKINLHVVSQQLFTSVLNIKPHEVISAYQYLGNLSDTDTSFQSQNLSRIRHLFCESI